MASYSKEARIIILLIIDVVFFLVEIIAGELWRHTSLEPEISNMLISPSIGYATGSLALVADSFHMLNDVMSLVVALYAVKVRSSLLWVPLPAI